MDPLRLSVWWGALLFCREALLVLRVSVGQAASSYSDLVAYHNLQTPVSHKEKASQVMGGKSQ